MFPHLIPGVFPKTTNPQDPPDDPQSQEIVEQHNLIQQHQ